MSCTLHLSKLWIKFWSILYSKWHLQDGGRFRSLGPQHVSVSGENCKYSNKVWGAVRDPREPIRQHVALMVQKVMVHLTMTWWYWRVLASVQIKSGLIVIVQKKDHTTGLNVCYQTLGPVIVLYTMWNCWIVETTPYQYSAVTVAVIIRNKIHFLFLLPSLQRSAMITMNLRANGVPQCYCLGIYTELHKKVPM